MIQCECGSYNVDALDCCEYCDGYGREGDWEDCPDCHGEGSRLSLTSSGAEFYECKACGIFWGDVPDSWDMEP